MANRPQNATWSFDLPSPSISSTEPDLLCEGIGASPGKITGLARHIPLEYSDDRYLPESKFDADNLDSGDIIVLAELSLGGENILRQAGGMIIGPTPEGLGSHSAAAARGLGVPTVITWSDPYSLIPNNGMIGLDGDLGRVYRGFRPR